MTARRFREVGLVLWLLGFGCGDRGAPPGPSSVTASAVLGPDFVSWRAPITVRWTPASPGVTDVKLERSAADASHEPTYWLLQPGEWTPLPATLTDTRYVDAEVQPLTAYKYRVSFGAGGSWSAPVESDWLRIDILPPTALTVTRIASGYHVSWQPSPAATGYRLTRLGLGGNPDDVVSLPASPASYDDPMDLAWPITQYQVSALYSSGGVYSESVSDRTGVPPFALSGPSLTLDASAMSLPPGHAAIMGVAGWFHLADDGTGEVPPFGPAVYRASGAGYDQHLLEGFARFAVPAIGVDAADHLHAVYLRTSAPGALRTIVHVWYDGAAWQEEDVASSNAADGLWFGVSADASVHVCWDEDFSSANGLVHAVKSAGVWSKGVVPMTDLTRVDGQFGVTADGTAYFLADRQFMVRPAGGSWTAESLPYIPWEWVTGLWLVPANQGGAAIAYETFVSPGPAYTQLWFVQQNGSGWGPTEWIANRPLNGLQTAMVTALTPDGTRAHAVLTMPNDFISYSGTLQILTRTQSGWNPMTIGAAMVSGAQTGYSGLGKVWVLLPPVVPDFTLGASYLEP